MEIRFGNFLLHRQLRQLHGPQGIVELGDRACDVLLALLEQPGEIVSKHRVMDAVWPGVAVEENTLQVHISALRKALGPSLIQTVHGRGYSYVGPTPEVVAFETALGGFGRFGTTKPGGVSIGRDRKTTSVAVFPFASPGDDRDQDLLADGLVEDLITELARFHHLTVIGHRITSHYPDRGARRDDAAHELGVDFVVDGSVRTGNGMIRVAVQLTDAETGAIVWGDRFTCALGEMFAVQDEIVSAVVARLAVSLDTAAEKQRGRDPTASGDAYLQFLRSRAHWRNGEPALALESALKAAEIDEEYGRAHAYVAFYYAYGRFGQWFDLPFAELEIGARSEIERAVALDPTDPFVLQRASMTYLMLGDPETALRYAEAAALKSALDSEILVIRGLALGCCGRKDEGAAMLHRALALEPRLSPGCYSALAEVLHMQQDYLGSQAALDMIPNPPFYFGLLKAANLARLGDTDGARRLVATFPKKFDCELFARSEAKLCARVEDAEHWLESFRLAGVRV